MFNIAILKNKIEVDLSNIPRKNGGKYYDWEQCINCTVPFILNNDISGHLIIKEYIKDKKQVVVEYNGIAKAINQYSLIRGNFTDIIINPELKQLYKLGEIVQIKNPPYKIKIINYGVRTKEGKESIFYQCLCPECGSIYYAEQNRLKVQWCPHCNLKKNNIAQTASWMISYFQGGYDEASKYFRSSQELIFPVCPMCGEIKKTPVKISTLYANGVNCKCNSHISFSENFMSSLLEQLNIEYMFQPTTRYLGFDDSLRRYDFYIPSLSLIIETNGIQHYKNIKNWNKSDQQFDNDLEKKNLALANGIKHYCELDCRKSNMNWVKNSIMKSKLPNLLGFTEGDIDWKLCVHRRYSSVAKEVCLDYKNNFLTPEELAKKYNVGSTTINKYLNTGNEYGWCVHTKDISTYKKPIEVLKDNKHVCYFKNMRDAHLNSECKLGISFIDKYISQSINQNKKYKGYIFKFVEDIQLRWDILQDNIS